MVSRCAAVRARQSNDLIGRMRRQHRQRLALARHRSSLARAIRRAELRLPRDPVEHAIARIARGDRETIRPAQFGDCGKATSSAASRERQPERLLAEIGQRSRADALEIAAIRRERQIERENLFLAERVFELKRAHDLPQLRAEAAMLARLQQARDLHAERRRAGDDMAVGHELEGGTASESGSTPNAREALVLIGKEQLEKARIDIFRVAGKRQRPSLVA